MNFQVILSNIKKIVKANLLKFKYWCLIRKLKKESARRKIVVAFCVSEIAKWKSQSLYDRLKETSNYRPVIFIYPSPLDFNNRMSNMHSLLEEKYNYFVSKGMEVVNVWDNTTQKCIIPNNSRPDILFYQQPWDVYNPFPAPIQTSDYALSFYIPYYLVNNFDIDLEFKLPLHYQVYRYIVQSEEVAKFYISNIEKIYYAGKCLGLGHTIVDGLTATKTLKDGDCVIYAPHFSFPVPGVCLPVIYSTFLDNGKLILQFAKQHPEINWVFKPHPRLKSELKETGVWTEAEVEAYYLEWSKLGVVCTTADYIEHFQNSLAMITDCGSFLSEYSCMDKPLIRLYYHKDNLPPNPILENLYKTFYYAHNNDELITHLENIIIKKQDPNKAKRHQEVVRLGFDKCDTSSKIINYLDSLFFS